MMRNTVCTAAILALILAGTAAATIQDTFTFTNVISEAVQGDAFNELAFRNSSAAETYTLQGIKFSATVAPEENPTDPGSYPTWGQRTGRSRDPSSQWRGGRCHTRSG